ncbi:MAG TPA: copper resistance protein CopC, partial [Marmoricola sp.]|nr:copper resistance protein CopC [Marmoricola sp.]
PVTSPAAGRGRARARLALVVTAVLWMLGSAVPAAQAHASLVSTDPAEGTVLAEPPGTITLTFSESVTLAAEATRLYDAQGHELEAEPRSADEVVTVVPGDEMAAGTYVLIYRVVSADSHPIAGSLTFSVGAPSERVVAPRDVSADAGPAVTALHGAVQGVTYLALLLAGGLAVFVVLLLPAAEGLEPLRRKVIRVVRLSAVVAAVAAVLLVPVGVVYQQGLDVGGLGTSGPWTAYNSLEGTLAALVLLGLGTAAWWLRDGPPGVDDRGVVLCSVGVALAAPALVGHTRGYGPGWLVVTSDVVHVTAAAVWFGGLVGLVLTLSSLVERERLAAATLARFSVVAGGLLTVVAVAGVLLGWRILGSWSALVTTAYGVILLCKTGLVGLVAAVAAWNRYRLLPAVVDATGHQRHVEAGRRLRTAVRIEASGLVVVLLLTGFLVNQVPREEVTAASRQAPREPMTAVGDDLRVVAHIQPGRVGSNKVTLHLRDLEGEPVEPYAAPRVTVRSDELDLGGRRARVVRPGTYETRVVIPEPGRWQLQVSVRTGEFTNPVLTLETVVR